jgi:hypothetical protein
MLQKIRIESTDGVGFHTLISINGSPVKLAQKAVLEVETNQWTTLSLIVLGDPVIETDGIVYLYTPDGRKWRVVEEALSSRVTHHDEIKHSN